MKRKYQKITGWWVYALITPDGMFYMGCSSISPAERWKPSLYKNKTIYPYIEKYGWDNIRKVVLCDGLTKQQALQLEDLLILEARKGEWCINKNRSGNIEKNNIKNYRKQYWKKHIDSHREYSKKYYQEHKNERREYKKQLRSTPEGKIYHRVETFNQRHPGRIVETPLEAKQKYLQWGYIPDYIKSDDLR